MVFLQFEKVSTAILLEFVRRKERMLEWRNWSRTTKVVCQKAKMTPPCGLRVGFVDDYRDGLRKDLVIGVLDH